MFFSPRGDIWNYTAYWEKVQIFEPKENVLPNCVTRFKELKELYEIYINMLLFYRNTIVFINQKFDHHHCFCKV